MGTFWFITGWRYLSGKISKIDLNVDIPIPIILISELTTPTGLIVRDNDLFFSQQTTDAIYKFNLASLPKLTYGEPIQE